MTDNLRGALERIKALDVPADIVDVMDSTARDAVEIAKAALAQQDAQTAPRSTSPTALCPYDPTEQMRWAAKQIDPALTHEQIRAMWCAMWSAATTPPSQRVMLADLEIELLRLKSRDTFDFACTLIEAYERKNGIK